MKRLNVFKNALVDISYNLNVYGFCAKANKNTYISIHNCSIVLQNRYLIYRMDESGSLLQRNRATLKAYNTFR